MHSIFSILISFHQKLFKAHLMDSSPKRSCEKKKNNETWYRICETSSGVWFVSNTGGENLWETTVKYLRSIKIITSAYVKMKNVGMQWKRKDEVRATNVRYQIYFDLRRRVLNKGLLLRNEELDFAGSDWDLRVWKVSMRTSNISLIPNANFAEVITHKYPHSFSATFLVLIVLPAFVVIFNAFASRTTSALLATTMTGRLFPLCWNISSWTCSNHANERGWSRE